MEAACRERIPEVGEMMEALENKIDTASELMNEIIGRLEAVIAPDAPRLVNPETAKTTEKAFNTPLAQHLNALKNKTDATIEEGENLLRRIEV